MRLGKLRELYKGEKDSQKTIGESTREERRKPQAQNPELRKMEREARNQLEKAVFFRPGGGPGPGPGLPTDLAD